MGIPRVPDSFDDDASRAYLAELIETSFKLETDPSRQLVTVLGPDFEKESMFRVPLTWPSLPGDADDLPEYLEAIPYFPEPYVMLLVQAGAAALGYFEEGEVFLHKTIKKYMTRKKQGKAQLNYLNTRGKSKAGSRIRLANTVRFFEEINERLTEWEEDHEPQRILYSCTARIWGMLFQSRVAPPFDKKDPRLLKIPRDVHVPSHEELLRINELSNHGWKVE